VSYFLSKAHRTDDQLLTVLDQSAIWTLYGRGGREIGRLRSLREAIRATISFETDGHRVSAVCQQPGDSVILFREQIARIASMIPGPGKTSPEPLLGGVHGGT